MSSGRVGQDVDCSCWQLPTPDAGPIAAGDLLSRPYLRVTLVDRSDHITGRPLAVCWAAPVQRRERYLILLVSKNDDIAAVLPESRIAYVATLEAPENELPLEPDDARPLFLEGISRLAMTQSLHDPVRYVVPTEDGSAHAVVTRMPHICLPGVDPLLGTSS